MLLSHRIKPCVYFIAIFYIYFLAAAASMNGMYEQWHFREGAPNFNFAEMYNQTASKPYVYRQLMPRAAEFLTNLLPNNLRTTIRQKITEPALDIPGETRTHMINGEASNTKYAVPYFIVYYLCVASLLIGMFFSFYLLRRLGFKLLASLVSPVVFILIFPAFETVGGYFYDCSEILFIFMFASIFQTRRAYLLAIPIAIIATINKESFPFYIIATAPLLLHNRFDIKRVVVLASSVVLTVAIHMLFIKIYAANPGGQVSFWLYDNLKFYANPLNLLNIHIVYRVIAPVGYNILFIFTLCALAVYGRSVFSTAMRWYFLVGSCVTFPLLLLFAAPGEMRNLSIFYPAFLLFVAASLQRLQSGTEGVVRLCSSSQWQLLADSASKRLSAFIARMSLFSNQNIR